MTLLLAPGFMTDADLWRDVEPAWARFAPVLHVDVTRDESIAAMARRALADTSGPLVVIGFSMGGYIAREVVHLAPERVRALVLIATSARGDTAAQTRRKADVASRVTDAGHVRLSGSAIAESLHPDPSRDGDALVRRLQAMGARLGPAVFRRQLLLDRGGDGARLATIRCPTLVIAGEHDRLRSRAEAEELHRGISGATLVVVEGVGHMIPLEAPGGLSDLVAAWLDTLDGLRRDEVAPR